jgi:two-component system NtrC family sensor kinase
VQERKRLLETLTGIRSSKKSYYVELKEKVREIARRNRQLETLNELSRSFNVEMSLEEMLELVTLRLRSVMPLSGVALYQVEGAGLSLRASSREGEGVVPQEADPGSLLAAVSLQGRSVVREDIAGAKGYPEDEALAASGIRSSALIPLVEKTGGILVFLSTEPGAFNLGDVAFLEQVTDQLLASMKNAHLYGEVLKSQREWEDTFGAVTDLLSVMDTQLRLIRFNRAVPRFHGRDARDLRDGHCYKVLMGLDSPCEHCPALEAMRQGKRAFQQVITPSGKILDVFAYPTFGDDGGVAGAITYSKDVTQLVHSSRFVALGQMAAGVAHELNSPLTAIVGEAQILLRDTAQDDPARDLLRDISNSGFRCKRIIQNLLTFSRQEEYTFEPVDLNEIVEKTLALVSYQIEKGSVQIRRDLEKGLPEVSASGQRIEQVLVNLLLNARDAVENTPEKLITIKTWAPSPLEVAVSVTDTGQGIPPEILPNIFDPFFTTKRLGKGTGLGLSVSVGIAEVHRGRIAVESQPGLGSTFILTLPLRRDEHEPE